MTANDNWSDLAEISEPITVYMDGMVSPSWSEWYIFSRYRESHSPMCERTLHNTSYEITMCSIDGSEQVTFITTFPLDKWDRFTTGQNTNMPSYSDGE